MRKERKRKEKRDKERENFRGTGGGMFDGHGMSCREENIIEV